MPQLGDLLRRFRIRGVPGAPSIVAVPVDPVARLENELAVVFSALDDAQRQAVSTRRAGEHAAIERRQSDLDSAHHIVMEARARVAATRAQAIAQRRARADADRQRLLDGARADADRIARRAADRVEELAARIVEHITSVATAEPHPPREGP